MGRWRFSTRKASTTRAMALALSPLMAFPPFAVDMYLPALPTIAAELEASQATMQLSLSCFMAAFGFGQLAWGPLGDRLGRRGPIGLGVILYFVASIGCAMAGDGYTLAAWRVLQGLGASAAPVLARAIVQDRYAPDQAARMLSLMMLIMGIAPMVAPLIGGEILLHLGWRAIFWFMIGFGGLSLVGLYLIPETLPPERRVRPSMWQVIRAYGCFLANRRYRSAVLAGGFFLSVMIAYISGTPFVYLEFFGISERQYGLLFAVIVVGMMVGSIANRVLVSRLGLERTFRLGAFASAGCALLLAVTGLTGFLGVAGIVTPVFMFLTMSGAVYNNAMALAMSTFPGRAGAASALAGCVQFLIGGLAGLLVGVLADGTPVPMIGVIVAGGMLAALAVLRRR